jgi:hypothetical protein
MISMLSILYRSEHKRPTRINGFGGSTHHPSLFFYQFVFHIRRTQGVRSRHERHSKCRGTLFQKAGSRYWTDLSTVEVDPIPGALYRRTMGLPDPCAKPIPQEEPRISFRPFPDSVAPSQPPSLMKR